MKQQKLKLLSVSLLSSTLLLILPAASVSAANLSEGVSADPGCVGHVSGSSALRLAVTAGSTVSLNLYNNDGNVTQSVSGQNVPSGTILGLGHSPESSQTFQIGPVNSDITLTITPIPTSNNQPTTVNYCPIGSTPSSSTLTLTPVAAPAPTPTPTPTPSSSSSSAAQAVATQTTTPAPASTPDAQPTSKDPAATPKTAVALDTKPKKTASVDTAAISAGLLSVLVVALALLRRYLPSKKSWKSLRKRFR